MANKKMTMGLIVGNRGFFPDHLAKSGREEMLRVLGAAGIDVVALTPEESKYGAVETREESRRCAELFKSNRERIDGVIVTLPNFGEERAIADTLRLADLQVPVLIQATPDDPQEDDHRLPPRQLLRQDVGLQQPAAIRHSVFDHHAAHRELRIRRSLPKICSGSPPSAAWWMASAICGSAPSARGRPRSTPFATARKFSNRKAFPSRRWISPKCWAASSA